MIEIVKRTLQAKGVQPADVVRFVQDRPGHDRRYWIQSSFVEERFSRFEDALVQTIDHYLQTP
jgi:dTDP-D-glucose 4,6-dehydratase